jgi:hypothetical protein
MDDQQRIDTQQRAFEVQRLEKFRLQDEVVALKAKVALLERKIINQRAQLRHLSKVTRCPLAEQREEK